MSGDKHPVNPTIVGDVLHEILTEYRSARLKFPRMNGPHEAYAVILEELDEFWDSVKENRADRKELIQVAAMVVAALVELPRLSPEGASQ